MCVCGTRCSYCEPIHTTFHSKTIEFAASAIQPKGMIYTISLLFVGQYYDVYSRYKCLLLLFARIEWIFARVMASIGSRRSCCCCGSRNIINSKLIFEQFVCFWFIVISWCTIGTTAAAIENEMRIGSSRNEWRWTGEKLLWHGNMDSIATIHCSMRYGNI